MKRPSFDPIGPLSYTPTIARELEAAGWKAEREPHEPVRWRDPLGLESGRLRTGEAWMLMQKRQRHGKALGRT